MDIAKKISEELKIQKWQTEAVVQLIDEGNTIPFIARYRKEAHGNLNDEQLRELDERLTYLRNLEDRKQTVIAAIQEQEKLTDELKKAIEDAQTLAVIEDLYRPYKQKRRTKAMIAKEKGLEPLADYILDFNSARPVEKEAEKYISEENEVPDAEAAISMAEDIIAEKISDNADFRTWIRNKTLKEGLLVTEKAKKSAKAKKEAEAKAVVNEKLAAREDIYEMYYTYSEQVGKIPGHRVLAINRGEKEKFLTVGIEAPSEEIVKYLSEKTGGRVETPVVKTAVHSFKDLKLMSGSKAPEKIKVNPVTFPYIQEAAADAYKRLIAPSIETEIRNMLTDNAEDGAIKVFGSNLTQLLMQAPVPGKVVLGWDPAFRTGCKLAVVDGTGKVLATKVIYPTEPQNKVAEAKSELLKLCKTYNVDLISCGNGTASRESEKVISDFIKETKLPIRYVIVNEAGASVYSASKLATKEFPNFDVGQRSAASIARRLQDPLAELVKIDPKAIGVGQYQHDMNQTKLGDTLTAVVEDCVNSVGVDVNTASAALLSYISGINKTIADNIVSYREENGRFTNRKQLKKVPKLGPKAFEQCAGFLRIRGGSEPLDMTGVHPESYDAAKELLLKLGFSAEDVASGKSSGIEAKLREASDKIKGGRKAEMKKLAEETGLGEFTLEDIIKELEKPGRDPREEVNGPVLRSDVLSMKDLKEGMVLKGTVRNIVDFGVFVDIGVHQDGLVHISQLSDKFVKHPLDVVKVGDIVQVKVLSVEASKNRIALTMKNI